VGLALAKNCSCCSGNCGGLRPGWFLIMPDAVGLLPEFIGFFGIGHKVPKEDLTL
jgi:hypothetical protein